KQGCKIGDKSAATIQRENVVRLMALKADKPAAANEVRRVIRALMKQAVEMKIREDAPTQNVRRLRSKSDGFHSWPEEEIETYEAAHAIGTRARLAEALLLYTGQRRSDVIRM